MNQVEDVVRENAGVARNHRRHIVLVALNWSRDKDPRLPLGHASILAALEAEGRSVTALVFDVNRGVSVDQVCEAVLNAAKKHSDREIDLGIGAYVWGEPIIQKLLPLLRHRGFRGRVILGGPQVSYMESGFEKAYPEVDVFVRGSGENALLAVASSADPVDHPGVLYAGNIGPISSATTNLDRLPSPWLLHDWQKEPLWFVRFETMRGCPFKCSFCQHRAPNQGPRLSYLPESRIMKEIDLFCAQKVESIAVLDPIFNVSPLSTKVLEAFAERGFRGRISLQCRAELIKPEFLDAAMKLNVTLEFGLQTIHDAESKAVCRQNKIDEVDEVLREVRARGIHHEVSLIFGLPNQTLDSFRASVAWCLERRVPVIKAFPLMLLRGTELEQDAAKWNLKESDDAIPIVISSSTFDHSDWQEMNAISAALRRTEGRHPGQLRELLANGEQCLETHRWTP